MSDGLARLNALPTGEAEAELLRCCGSTAWARRVAEGRPYASLDALKEAGDATWWSLAAADWLEAFSRHPRIGEARAARPDGGDGSWSRREQAGVAVAADDTRAALAEGNAAYEERFGWIYLVCASGRSGQELLDILRSRLGNDPDTELRVAAEEQRRITHLRLERLVEA